ncbi:MAG: hypothetical protein B7Z73_02740, partial [Planctomycetia bacterium 21-64-5]
KAVSLRGNRRGFEAYTWAEAIAGNVAGVRFDFSRGEHVAAFCQSSRAVVLSYDCEIDQDSKHLLVALVRPLGVVQEPENRRVIRENRNFSFWYLPSDDRFQLVDSYVDLRRLTCLDQSFVNGSRKLASLASDAVRSLQRQIMLYLTRREPL